MYTDIHTTIGTTIFVGVTALTGNSFIGVSCAIMSHFIADFIMESKYGKDVLYQLVFHSLFITLGYSLGLFWQFVIGAIAGNLFDLIDKKMMLFFYDNKRFPATYLVHIKNQKKGIKITSKTTKTLTLVNIMIVLSVLIFNII